jgi:hypothetical protein
MTDDLLADGDDVLDVKLTPDEVIRVSNMTADEMIEFFTEKTGGLHENAVTALRTLYAEIVSGVRRTVDEDPVFRKVQ